MATATSSKCKTVTPPEAARELGVHPDKITYWIASGELRASNLARDANGRKPRYRIMREDLEAFLASRAVPGPAPKATRRRRKAQDVTEYF